MAAGWRWRRATLWAAVAVVVGLALAIGAGAFSSGYQQTGLSVPAHAGGGRTVPVPGLCQRISGGFRRL